MELLLWTMGIVGIILAFILFTKARHKTEMLTLGIVAFATLAWGAITEDPKTKTDHYQEIFGRSICKTELLHYKDSLINNSKQIKWIHFRTCPKEIKRIIKEKNLKYDVSTLWFAAPDFDPEWWSSSYSLIGAKGFEGEKKTLIIKGDSTEAYYDEHTGQF